MNNLSSKIKKNPQTIQCFHCRSQIKNTGLFAKTKTLNKLEKLVLKEYKDQIFCVKCIDEIKKEAFYKIEKLKIKFKNTIEQMPVLSIENPCNLTTVRYCKVITSQTIANTETIKEFIYVKNLIKTNEFFRKEINKSENQCLDQLKINAIGLGANIIIGCDIEYAELSLDCSTFLIAMTGTAAIVEEFNIFNEKELEIFNIIYKSN